MTKPSIDLQTLLHEADYAFWEVVVRHYPEATSGDLSPLTTFQLQQAEEEAVKEWIWANVPQSRRPATTYFNEADQYTYWLRENGELVAAETSHDGQVDWAEWTYVDALDQPPSDAKKQRILNCLNDRPDRPDDTANDTKNAHQKGLNHD